MLDSLMTIGSFIVLVLVLRLVFGYLGFGMKFINRYTWNIIPKTMNLIGNIVGTGLGTVFIVALLLGYGTGFYALYEGTVQLTRVISRHVSSIETSGIILDADNRSNMSQALVEFEDQDGNQYQQIFTANYNGTYYSKGSSIPVYYLPGNVERSATLNITGGYIAVGFLFFYGFAVAGFFSMMVFFRVRDQNRGKRRGKRIKKWITIKLPVVKIYRVGNSISLQVDYREAGTGKIHHLYSAHILESGLNLKKLEGAGVLVRINPQNPEEYDFDENYIRNIATEK